MTIPPDEPPTRHPATGAPPVPTASGSDTPAPAGRSEHAAGDVAAEVDDKRARTAVRLDGGPAAGGGTVSAVRAAPRAVASPTKPPRPLRPALGGGSRRSQEQWAVRAVSVAAAVGGALVDVAPTGNRVADPLLAAGFAALLAAAASTAKRWTWFIPAGVALALADGRIAFAAGAIGLLLALASTRPTRPAPAVGAAVGGLAAVALLRSVDLWFHGATAIVAAAAVTPLLLSGYRYAGRRTRRRVRRAAVAAAVAVVAIGGGYGALLAQSRDAAERGLQRFEGGMDAARQGDDVLAEQRFAEAAEGFATAERSLGSWWAEPAEVLPVVGHNARAIQALATTAGDLSRQSRQAAADADVDQLTVAGGRLDLARVRALEQPLIDVAAALEDAADRMDAVDTPWLARPVAERVARVRSEVADARPDARIAADAVRVVPAIFGGEGESRWLVAFVSPAEARGRSGFPGNFAELVAVDGDVEMTRFGRIGELESAGTPAPERTLAGPADYLARWGRYSPTTTWRNITMSPDFPSVGQVMAELYPQSGGRPIDGVIAVDPTALAALLEFTGPVTVQGVPAPLTAENAADFMLFDQYVILPETGERVDVLERLARTTFDRLTSGDLPGPRQVAESLGPAVRDGHIQLYGVDRAQQRLFTEIGADGALPAVKGDFLSVVNSNATGNKIDGFLSRQIDYHATWDPTAGPVSATVKVTLVNDAPGSGLPDYLIGNALGDGADLAKGTNRTHLSIYSPLVLQGADVDGQGVEIAPEVERDRYAYSLFVDVPPGGGRRTVTLELQGRIAGTAGAYRLDVAGQPLATPDRLRVTVESAGGEALKAKPPMQVEGATAAATVRPTTHETTMRVVSEQAKEK